MTSVRKVCFVTSIGVHLVAGLVFAWYRAAHGDVAYGTQTVRLYVSGDVAPTADQLPLPPARPEQSRRGEGIMANPPQTSDHARAIEISPAAVTLVESATPAARKPLTVTLRQPVELADLQSLVSEALESVAGLESGAEAIDAIVPVYPVRSRRTGEEGVVRIAVEIAPSGEPVEVQIVESSGYPRLDDAARAAVLQARFTPAHRFGRPSASQKTFRFIFELTDTRRS